MQNVKFSKFEWSKLSKFSVYHYGHRAQVSWASPVGMQTPQTFRENKGSSYFDNIEEEQKESSDLLRGSSQLCFLIKGGGGCKGSDRPNTAGVASFDGSCGWHQASSKCLCLFVFRFMLTWCAGGHNPYSNIYVLVGWGRGLRGVIAMHSWRSTTITWWWLCFASDLLANFLFHQGGGGGCPYICFQKW